MGRGAYAAVHRMRRDGVDYAVKSLDPMVAADQRTLTTFRREAALLARVNHPTVPRVFDVGLAGGRPYLVMEFVDGRPLSTLIATARLAEAQIARLGADVAGALAAAHRAGLIHRDVKPANILITEDGSAHLIDFGLAATGRADAGTGDGPEAIAGTLEYSPPEQTGMLARPVDGRADLYALGVVLFECATGDLPFRPATSWAGSRSWPNCAAGGAGPRPAPADSPCSPARRAAGRPPWSARSRTRWPQTVGLC